MIYGGIHSTYGQLAIHMPRCGGHWQNTSLIFSWLFTRPHKWNSRWNTKIARARLGTLVRSTSEVSVLCVFSAYSLTDLWVISEWPLSDLWECPECYLNNSTSSLQELLAVLTKRFILCCDKKNNFSRGCQMKGKGLMADGEVFKLWNIPKNIIYFYLF